MRFYSKAVRKAKKKPTSAKYKVSIPYIACGLALLRIRLLAKLQPEKPGNYSGRGDLKIVSPRQGKRQKFAQGSG